MISAKSERSWAVVIGSIVVFHKLLKGERCCENHMLEFEAQDPEADEKERQA